LEGSIEGFLAIKKRRINMVVADMDEPRHEQ
jgi:hypothetical protein